MGWCRSKSFDPHTSVDRHRHGNTAGHPRSSPALLLPAVVSFNRDYVESVASLRLVSPRGEGQLMVSPYFSFKNWRSFLVITFCELMTFSYLPSRHHSHLPTSLVQWLGAVRFPLVTATVLSGHWAKYKNKPRGVWCNHWSSCCNVTSVCWMAQCCPVTYWSPTGRLLEYWGPLRQHQSNNCLWDDYRCSALFVGLHVSLLCAVV